ncbi:MAG TPA: hypothetical protein VK906_08390 [Egicoccus sp.]|nr:hypothetical protein [Egicoccus sp.]HSK23179.1 hypothetical protein [Egicoccus sp.]
MDPLIALLTGLLVAAVILLSVWVFRRPSTRRATPQAWGEDRQAAGARVVLDLVAHDPEDPALQRLVRETAMRAMQSDTTVDRVEVVDADGNVLGSETRPTPLPGSDLPDELHEPQLRRSRSPSVVPRARPHAGVRRPDPDAIDLTTTPQPLADRLTLVADIRRRIRQPDRAVDVVRAILEAAGRPAEVRGDLVVSGDVAIAVVDTHTDPEGALTRGYLRIREAGVARGIVLRLGHVDPKLVRRREAAAPHVRHVAVDALQRMADAAAVGADPIAFAAAPAVRR